jgi:hypothetical protein
MPANVTSIIMKAVPGGELACRAHEMDVNVNGLPVRRGIISYYATSTMGKAANMQSWTNLMEQKSAEDLKQHKITIFYKPNLQICGDPSLEVIGERRLTEIAEGFDKNTS